MQKHPFFAVAWLCVALGAPGSARAETPPSRPSTACPEAPQAPASPHPWGEGLLGGEGRAYAPQLTYMLGERCMTLEVPASLAARLEYVGAIPVDAAGHALHEGALLDPELRVGAVFDSQRAMAPLHLRAELEVDVLTGVAATEPDVAGVGMPGSDEREAELRKAYVMASLGYDAHLTLGVTTSHWGLGLVANDGDHGWEPGSARFADPRGGDRVLRAALGTGPLGSVKLAALVAVDALVDDDVLLTGGESPGADDAGHQIVGAATIGHGGPHSLGAYVARRHQETAAGHATDVWAFDMTGKTEVGRPSRRLRLEAEAALVSGTTGLAPTVRHPEHDVLQLGAQLRATFDAGAFGAALDVLYASGDRNLDDGAQNAFRADPNDEMGLLLFRHVIAAQTARGAVTAGDPGLVGLPTEDLDRVPTRGSVTNTIAIFPRLRYRPLDGLETYGGPLFAFAPVETADPLETRLAGGEPHTALGGRSGRYLGTELDVGVRYRAIYEGAEITLGLEAGVLTPRSALRGAPGSSNDDAIGGGRALARLRL